MFIYVLICNTCKELKTFDKFSKKNGSKRAYSHRCKVCHNDYVRNVWYKNNCESQRTATKKYKADNKFKVLSKKYNTTEAVIKKLFKNSNNSCEVCGTGHNLCVDHCHTSGVVRGILCKSCNTSLGMLREDSDRILKLAEYAKTKCSNPDTATI